MSAPDIRGFSGATPLEPVRITDASDDKAFNIGVVAPGGSVTNYECWWWNYGYAKLYDGQISLIAHPTLDLGANSDTIDVMNLGAPFAGEALSKGVIGTRLNTAGWTYPLPHPWTPFEDKFAAGIKWDPPSGATPGAIRKAFQWDGAYHPDGWDFILYPMGNEYLPDSVYLDYPMGYLVNGSPHSQKIQVDASYPTGFKWQHWKSVSTTEYEYYQFPNSAGNPWYDNVDNATGYIVSLLWEPLDINGGENCGIEIEDGVYKYVIYSKLIAGVKHIGITSSWHTGVDTWSPISAGKKVIDIIVIGNSLSVEVDSVLAFSVTLNSASAQKWLRWGALPSTYSTIPGTSWGHADFGYIKFYCGGTTKPTT